MKESRNPYPHGSDPTCGGHSTTKPTAAGGRLPWAADGAAAWAARDGQDTSHAHAGALILGICWWTGKQEELQVMCEVYRAPENLHQSSFR